MEYIQSLLKELDELGKLKKEVIMSMKESKNIERDGETNNAKPLHTVTSRRFVEPSLVKHANTEAKSSTVVVRHSSRDTNHAHAMTIATSKDLKGNLKVKDSTKVGTRKNKVKFNICSENRSQNRHDKNQRGKDGANDGKELYNTNTNTNGCGGHEKIDDVARCPIMNGDESLVESDGKRIEVGVRFYGEDAFINVLTTKRRVEWSSLLEVLQQLGIYVLNVTFFTSSNFHHHHIHAKVSRSCNLSSSDLEQRLIAWAKHKKHTCKERILD